MFSRFWWSVRFNPTLKMILPRRGKRDPRNTFWRVRWDQRSRMTYGIMIEEVIDTFRYNTPALEQQEFIRNSQIEASTFHTLSIKKWSFSHVFSGEAILTPNFEEDSTVKNVQLTNTCHKIINWEISSHMDSTSKSTAISKNSELFQKNSSKNCTSRETLLLQSHSTTNLQSFG